MTESELLTNLLTFDVNNVIMTKMIEGKVPSGNGKSIKTKRVRLGKQTSSGKVVPLIIDTPGELFSFGIQENKSSETGQVTGHSMPLCIYKKDDPTDDQKLWVKKFNELVEHIKQLLLDARDENGMSDLHMNDLFRLNPLYWKKENGKIVPGTGPILYAKMMERAAKYDEDGKLLENARVNTIIQNKKGDMIDPLNPQNHGKWCTVDASINIESVFFGAKTTLQVKMYDGIIDMLSGGMVKLKTRNVSNEAEHDDEPVRKKVVDVSEDEEDDENEDGDAGGDESDTGSIDDAPVKPLKKVKKTKFKKVKKRNVKTVD